MSIKTTAAVAAALTLTAFTTDSHARSCDSGETIVSASISDVTHRLSRNTAYRSDGFRFAQAVTHQGDDSGMVRMANDRLEYQESDWGGEHLYGETVHSISVCDVDAFGNVGSWAYESNPNAEVGSFTIAPEDQTDYEVISFDNEYDNPVLFVQVVTKNGTTPVAPVPVTVYGTGAIIALMEPDAYDGEHWEETIHWMVIEAGEYDFGDGNYAKVGSIYVETEAYQTTDDMTSIVPTVEYNSGGAFVDNGTEEVCLENARIIAAPQAAVDTDYSGTRVLQQLDGDVLTSFGVRHMRTETYENSASAEATAGYIGYLVIGEASSTSCSASNDETWDEEFTSIDFTGDAGSATDSANETVSDILSAFCDGGSVVDQVWSQDDTWGDTTAGANYAMQAGLSDYRSEGGELWLGGKADGNIALLGESFTVFDVGVEATADSDDNSDGRAWLVVMEGILDFPDYDEDLSTTVDLASGSVTFFEASGVFYGVTVTASAEGSLGVAGTGSISGSTIGVNVTPEADLSASASASIGVWCVSADITGSLTLVNVAVPVDIDTTFTGASTAWSVDADIELSSLDGSLDLGVSWCVGDDSYNLFSINGFSDSYGLIDEGGCF